MATQTGQRKGEYTMKKNEQIEVNTYVENIVNDINALTRTLETPIKWRQLYRCSADMGIVKGGWILLKSYSTIVAAYNIYTDELFDFLRLVYGYTATSAQHIAKFRNYCRGEFGNSPAVYRWYAV